MVKKILLPILLLYFFSIANAQWFPQNSGITDNLYDIEFVNDSTGFVVGGNGNILKTIDGGNTWTQLNSNIMESLYCISIISENIGWVAGNNGVILKTNDRGNSWNPQMSGTTETLFAIQFLDENHGWASKLYDEILLTTDSGINWVSYTTGINNTILTLSFSDLNTGWVGGWGGTVMKTIDGGLTWAPQWSGTSITRRSLFFINNNTGWSAGGGGVITKTTNGGASWTQLNSGSSVDFASIFFTCQDTGWAAGQDKIYGTFDGGTSWHIQLNEYGQNFNNLWFKKSYLGWVVGSDGSIYKYENKPTLHLLYPNGGEEYFVEQTKYIGWQSFDIDSITIEYSTDNGINWMFIADSIPTANENYKWVIPNSPSSECLVKICDINDPSIFDISDGSFFINRSPQIVSPNGGENLYFNHMFNVQWTYGGSENIKIELSRDNGNSWEIIADSTSGLSGNFTWLVTPPKSNQSLIKITDNDFPDFFDISDVTFHIDTLILPYHYFPLAQGNKWFFKEYGETILTILSAEKDTILNDGFNYTQIATYLRQIMNDTFTFGGFEYYRQTGDSIIIYPDRILLNFNWQIGDTIITDSINYFCLYISDIRNEIVFGRNLTTYYIYMTQFEYYSCTDGIGFNTLYASDWHNYYPRYLAGCIIDGIQYGNIITSENQKNEYFVKNYRLDQNYPNPFNSSTIISFSVPKRVQVSITIYDINGRKINTILNQVLNSGEHFIEFNALYLASGIYYYHMQAGEYSEGRKFLYIK